MASIFFILLRGNNQIMNDEKFKGNSNASKEQIAQPSKAITTNVVVKNSADKKPEKRFFAEDARTVGSHVVNSVVVPSLQKLLSDGVKSAIDWLIYGSRGGPKSTTGVGTVSYSRFYNNPSPMYTQPSYVNPQVQRSNVYAVNDILFNDRGEAEEVLLRMKESVQRYGSVSVADFYDLIGQRSAFTDNKYGWYDLNMCDIIRDGSGYSIRFPRVQPLDQ